MSSLPCTILVVDDESQTRIILSYMLSHICPDVQVISCGSIQEALEIFDTIQADCVLTDYSLGGDTGLSLARTLRLRSENLPILLITGFETALISEQAMAAGCTSILAKPVTVNELRRAILPLVEAYRTTRGQA